MTEPSLVAAVTGDAGRYLLGDGRISVVEADAPGDLAVDVVVVGPAECSQVAAAQRLHRAHPEATVVLVVPTGDPHGVRRAVVYAPDVPGDLVLHDEGAAADLARRAFEVGSQAVQRRHHRQLLAALAHRPRGRRRAPRPVSTALGTVLDHAPLGVLLVDPSGALESWNARAVAMVGAEAAQAGRPLADLFSDPRPVAAALASAAAAGVATPVAVQVACGVEVSLELSVVSTQLDDGRAAFLVLLLDVTTRRQAEDARDRMQGRLQLAQRSQEFLLLASDVLAQASGYAETLEQLAAVAVPTLGDMCLIDVVEDEGVLRRAAVRHADPAAQPVADELRRDYPLLTGGLDPAATAVHTQQTQWDFDLPPDHSRPRSRDDHHYELVARLQFTGYIAVPLVAGGDVLGCVTLVVTGSRRFTPDDLALAEELAGRVAQVVFKARRYDQEHRVAAALQRSMLPSVPQVAGLEVAARYVPAREDAQVGGDWYDVFQFPGHDPVVVVGDVVGHDLEAATQMGQLRNVLRGLAWNRARQPAEVLTMLDDVNGSLGIADLATVVCGTISPAPNGAAHLRWSNAGHLPPLLVSADGAARYLDEVGDLLIGLPGTGARHQAGVELPAGSTLLLYTDGLVESRLDQLDSGMGALLELAARLAAESVEVLCDRLVTALAADAEDDIALLVIRVPDR